MYNLHIYPKAGRSLKRISRINQEVVLEALDTLRDDPYLGKPLTQELTGRLTYKIGVYRIIYSINEKDKNVKILKAGHRATVYN